MDDVRSADDPSLPITFVLRIAAAEPELMGVVELVRTGEKHRFRGAEALGSLIARMTAPARVSPPEGAPS